MHYYGHNPVLFDVDGRQSARGGDYRAINGRDGYLDESFTIYGAISEMAKEAAGNEPSKMLEACVQLLKKSAGR